MSPGRKDPRAEPDDDHPGSGAEEIDIAAAVRAAKTAEAHGRVPAAQATAKMGAFELEQALAKVHAAGKDEPTPATPVESPKAEEPPKVEEQEQEQERPKKVIPIPEPSEPGPMVSSIREPRIAPAPRGIPRSTVILVLIAIALIGGLYAWSRTLR